MEELVFTPKYSSSVRIGFVFLPIAGGFFLILGINNNDLTAISLGVFMLLVSILSLAVNQRQIIFSREAITLKRGLLPNLVLHYRDFTDIGTTRISFGKKSIALAQLENAQELVDIFSKLIADKKIQASQIEGKLVIEEAITSKAFTYSIIPVLILSVLVNILLNNILQIQINGRFVSLAVFLIVFFGIYFLLKRRSEVE